MINGQQMTVSFHVDDLKVTCKSELEITKFILYLGKLYGNKITVNQGDVHNYLGMDLDSSEKSKGIVKISMINYVEKILQDFPEQIKSTSSSPAAERNSRQYYWRIRLSSSIIPLHNCCFCQPGQEKIFRQQWHFSQ